MKNLYLLLIILIIAACNNQPKQNEISKTKMESEMVNQNANDNETSTLTDEEQNNMQVIGILAETAGKYIAKEITADQFAKELSNYMAEDIVFWSNYTPTNESLKPLFAQRNGINEILERYDYEEKYEKIKEGTGLPVDFAIKGNAIYYSQNETASFFDKEEVTWDMVTKITMKEGKISRIEMYLDSAPIEKIYGQKEQ